jgi:N-carbamoyl-L-amino-acid hydrolase
VIDVASAFDRMWSELEPIGRTCEGGYRRFAWTADDQQLRDWFEVEAERRGLSVTTDRGGNQWAWWGDPDVQGPGVVTGSHLDSVPNGGAFDGPLGVVSALLAVDVLSARGWRPSRPIGVAAFSDEEGGRFGIACAGSRLITGDLAAEQALALTDDDGVTMAEAIRQFGRSPDEIGADPETVGRIGVFVELHVEQGRGLIDLGRPVAVGNVIWPHGRWRITLEGEANHAGTTPLGGRSDPMLRLAHLITDARAEAERSGALATVGKVRVTPNGVNAIPSRVTAWLDCRAPQVAEIESVIAGLEDFSPVRESWTEPTVFDADLSTRLAEVVGADSGQPAPVLGTGAGHDAGVLSNAGVPTAMLFVRNPTGASHTPAEHADRIDCLAGIESLAAGLMDLTSRAGDGVAD